MRLVLSLVLGMVLITITAPPVKSLEFHKLQDKSSSKQRADFRYVIVFNDYLHNGRLVWALMDDKAFSEVNLRELFKLISKRFPDPGELHVAVLTSLEQIPTPEEMDHAVNSLRDSDPMLDKTNFEKYPGAIYHRTNGNEVFSYSMGFGKGIENTVVIKGEDFMHGNNKKP